MSVVNTDLVIYTASDMPENNTSIVGGDINSGIRASFDDPSSLRPAYFGRERMCAASAVSQPFLHVCEDRR